MTSVTYVNRHELHTTEDDDDYQSIALPWPEPPHTFDITAATEQIRLEHLDHFYEYVSQEEIAASRNVKAALAQTNDAVEHTYSEARLDQDTYEPLRAVGRWSRAYERAALCKDRLCKHRLSIVLVMIGAGLLALISYTVYTDKKRRSLNV